MHTAGALIGQLKPERALPGDHRGVVVRVAERPSALAGAGLGKVVLVSDSALRHHARTRRASISATAAPGREDLARHAERACREGQRLGVVAGAAR